MTDPAAFCRHFYAAFYLPVAHYCQGAFSSSVGFPEDSPLYQTMARPMFDSPQTPAACSAADTGLYGLIREKASGDAFLIGPVYGGGVTDEMLRAYLSGNALPASREGEIMQFLCAIPPYSYHRFLNVLLFLHLFINGEELSVVDHFRVSDLSLEQEIAARHAQTSYLARDERQQHGTYSFERQMLACVRQGDPQRMRRFLLDTVTHTPLVEGKLAESPLRQAKNLFIGTVTMVGKDGAIPGGLDIEQTYQLIDAYIQECERMQSLDEVKSLQFNMLMDFTGRVAGAQSPEGVSGEIFSCMQYIGAHLNERVSIQDVADHIGRSRAYTAAKFKRETGKTIGAYLTHCRVQEARALLKYTDKPLGEISDYLCFSSQSHFQNVFKAQTGVTPAKYRRGGE